MPPDSGGICMEVDERNHQIAPGLPPGWVRSKYNISTKLIKIYGELTLIIFTTQESKSRQGKSKGTPSRFSDCTLAGRDDSAEVLGTAQKAPGVPRS